MLPNNNQQQIPVSQKNTAESVLSTQHLTISDVLLILVSNWYWILLCVIIGYGAANLYLRKTRPVYTRKASILLKDMNKNNILGTSAYGYSDASLMIQSVDLTNEIFTIKSPVVMSEVVRRLNLQMQYEIEGRFRNSVLYGSNLPIDVKMLEAKEEESCSVTVAFESDSTFVLSNFNRNGRLFEGTTLTGQLGKTLSTPIGNLVVTASPYYYRPVYPIIAMHMRAQAALAKYSGELKVMSEAGSTIINLQVTDHDTQRAEEILHSLIGIYNEQWINDRNQVSISTNQFISERLNVIENELGNVDSSISDYKSDNLIIGNAESMAGMYVSQAQSANSQIIGYNNQLYLARSLRTYLTTESNYMQLLPSSQGLSNASIAGQISQYNSLVMRRNNLVSASSLENPIVQDLDAQLAALRSTMISSIDNHINELNLYIRTAQGIKAQSNTKVAASPSQNKHLLSIERQQKVKESLYLFLLQKREENELSQAFTAYNNRVVTPPSGSNTPTSPVALRVYAFCILLGLLIPIAYLILREITNTSVRGRKDLENLKIPFLGELPLMDNRSRFSRFIGDIKERYINRKHHHEDKTLHIVVKENSTNIMNEAFRVIRTNMEFVAGKGDGARVIMLTSFNPNSGKTFIVSNLGMALTFKKKRTLVIDLDMRKRSLSALVGKHSKGLSNYLGGYVDDYRDLIKSVPEVPELEVLPAGKIPPNPTELLYDQKLDELIASVRKDYDYIFLDCPPLEIVADATIISRLADMTIFVIRAEALQLSALPDVQKYYDENRLPKMTILLNAPTDAFSRYGYHKYGSRYGYSYGYGRSYKYGYGYGYAYGTSQDKDKEEDEKDE
jgi:capsular exopolysaccharide synthesis family protein